MCCSQAATRLQAEIATTQQQPEVFSLSSSANKERSQHKRNLHNARRSSPVLCCSVRKVCVPGGLSCPAACTHLSAEPGLRQPWGAATCLQTLPVAQSPQLGSSRPSLSSTLPSSLCVMTVPWIELTPVCRSSSKRLVWSRLHQHRVPHQPSRQSTGIFHSQDLLHSPRSKLHRLNRSFLMNTKLACERINKIKQWIHSSL